MSGKLIIAVALIGAIAGLSTTYWLQAAINNKVTIEKITGVPAIFGKLTAEDTQDNVMGIKWDKATFGITIVTSLLAIVAICLIAMGESNSLFRKVSMGISCILCIMWIAMLIVYCVRKYDDVTEVDKEDVIMVLFAFIRKYINYKRREIVEAVIYMLLAGAAALFHLLAGVLRK